MLTGEGVKFTTQASSLVGFVLVMCEEMLQE